MEVTNIEVKKFKVGEVVSSPNGVGNVLNINDDRRDLYPVQVIYADGRTISYTRDGRPHADYELVSLFHGEGTVKYKMVFAPKPEPVPPMTADAGNIASTKYFGNVTKLSATRADIRVLVDELKAQVYLNGEGFSMAEIVGVLELIKLNIIEEQKE